MLSRSVVVKDSGMNMVSNNTSTIAGIGKGNNLT